MFTFTLTNDASKTERQQIQSQCFTLSKYSDLYYILPASSYSTVCLQAEDDETAVRPRQGVRGRAKAKTIDEAEPRPRQKSRGKAEPRQTVAEADSCRGTAEARQAGKLPRGGLEARQLPRGLHHYSSRTPSLTQRLHYGNICHSR